MTQFMHYVLQANLPVGEKTVSPFRIIVYPVSYSFIYWFCRSYALLRRIIPQEIINSNSRTVQKPYVGVALLLAIERSLSRKRAFVLLAFIQC